MKFRGRFLEYAITSNRASFVSAVLFLPFLLLIQDSGQAPPKTSASSSKARLESLTELQLEGLKNKQRQYDKMPTARQKQLRELHAKIMSHEDRDELFNIMRRYSEWLRSLDEKQKIAVRQLPIDERIKEIRRIQLEQAEEYFGVVGDTQLPAADVPKLFEWIDQFVANNRDQIINQLSKGNVRRSRYRRNRLLDLYLKHALRNDLTIVTDKDLNSLREKLSPDAIQIIDSQTTENEQQKLVVKWMITAMEANFQVSVRDLMEFYHNDMTDDQRERVDQMTPERRRAEIRWQYNRKRRDPNLRGLVFDRRSGRRPGGDRQKNNDAKQNDEQRSIDQKSIDKKSPRGQPSSNSQKEHDGRLRP